MRQGPLRLYRRAVRLLRPPPYYRPRHLAHCGRLWLLDRVGRRRYRLLAEQELRATRTSETVWLLGSGRSLLDITPEQWEVIGSTANTVSFRDFPRQRFVRADYHLTGEVDFVEEYAARIRENPLYRDTVFVVQGGLLAEKGNDLIGRGLLPRGARVFRFSRISRGNYAPPSASLRELVHGFGSIVGVVNFAVAMGWRRIVVAGVDLYDKQYFWLPAGEARPYEYEGLTAESPFLNVNEIVDMLGRWHELVGRSGVELLVHNPRSRLAERLPVHAWKDAYSEEVLS